MGLAKEIRIWKCDNCGKEEAWNDHWLEKLILHKGRYLKDCWDEQITVCSDKCARQFDENRKRKK